MNEPGVVVAGAWVKNDESSLDGKGGQSDGHGVGQGHGKSVSSPGSDSVEEGVWLDALLVDTRVELGVWVDFDVDVEVVCVDGDDVEIEVDEVCELVVTDTLVVVAELELLLWLLELRLLELGLTVLELLALVDVAELELLTLVVVPGLELLL